MPVVSLSDSFRSAPVFVNHFGRTSPSLVSATTLARLAPANSQSSPFSVPFVLSSE